MRHFLEILKSWGPWGVFTVSLVESSSIPTPGGTDFLLLFIAAVRPEEAMLSGILAIAGAMIGSVIFYEITRRGGEKLLAQYTSTGRGKRFRMWFLRYGLITVFIPALLPIPFLPFKAFAACAGAMRVPRLRFFLVLAAARIPRFLALAWLGMEMGEHSGTWLRGHLWYLIAAAALLTAALSYFAQRVSLPLGDERLQ
jgi:membrane protein YqaA with SNARE-associated domain